jgi:hypothetical protein
LAESIYLLSAAEQLNVTSTSTNDTSAGSGARTLFVEGLDSSRAVISETLTMNGTSIVVTSNSYLRVNKITVASAGTSGYNEGTITIQTSASPTDVLKRIGVDEEGIGLNVSFSTHWTVPASWTGFVSSFHGTARDAILLRYTLRYRDSNGLWFPLDEIEAWSGETLQHDYRDYELVVPGGSDVVVRGLNLTNSNSVVAQAGYTLTLTDDTQVL